MTSFHKYSILINIFISRNVAGIVPNTHIEVIELL